MSKQNISLVCIVFIFTVTSIQVMLVFHYFNNIEFPFETSLFQLKKRVVPMIATIY